MIGFLQGFHSERILIEVKDDYVRREVLQQAVEIAMLGLVNECNSICKVLTDHGQFDSSAAGLEFQCMWMYSDLQPPDTKDGAVWIPSKQDVRQRELDSRKDLAHLPEWMNWENFDASTLERMQSTADETCKNRFAAASTGFAAMRLSAELAAISYMASDLDDLDVLTDLMPRIASRIHANQQGRYLSGIPIVWREYLVKGWLRERLSLTEQAVREYASFVLDVTKRRFKNGTCRPEDVHAGYSISQLLGVIDENTVSSPDYFEWLKETGSFTAEEEADDGKVVRQHHSIIHPGASSEQIEETEQRLGHKMPDDLVDFYKLANGCDRIRVGEYHYMLRLPPLDQLSFEDEDYMTYGFEVVPRLPRHLNVEWPEIEGGGIAMYEHDGQGTEYVWILRADAIQKSKEQLRKTYDKASDDDKAIVDRYIRYWYGSREVYDAMTEYCYYMVLWGDGAQAIYPTFKSYLAAVACESRQLVERSPLKVPDDD